VERHSVRSNSHQTFPNLPQINHPAHRSLNSPKILPPHLPRWKQVFNKQDYANLVGTIIIGAVTATITFHGEPRTLDYYYWDATISYPYGGAPTVPEWVIIFIPIAMAVLTLAVGELMYSRMLHRSLTDALATMVC
jgi:hypothetical protein